VIDNAGKEPLKLVVVYDRNRNEYSITQHNLSPDEAQAFVERWNPHMTQGSSLISLDQPRRHGQSEPNQCRACRLIVVRSARVEPQPKFIRRNTP